MSDHPPQQSRCHACRQMLTVVVCPHCRTIAAADEKEQMRLAIAAADAEVQRERMRRAMFEQTGPMTDAERRRRIQYDRPRTSRRAESKEPVAVTPCIQDRPKPENIAPKPSQHFTLVKLVPSGAQLLAKCVGTLTHSANGTGSGMYFPPRSQFCHLISTNPSTVTFMVGSEMPTCIRTMLFAIRDITGTEYNSVRVTRYMTEDSTIDNDDVCVDDACPVIEISWGATRTLQVLKKSDHKQVIANINISSGDMLTVNTDMFTRAVPAVQNKNHGIRISFVFRKLLPPLKRKHSVIAEQKQPDVEPARPIRRKHR